MRKFMYATVLTTLMVNLAACGTILYPERKGQRGGRIDAGIAVLDGVGLLFFLIPGVIAYAVDFSTGTIYLPGGKHADLNHSLDKNNLMAFHVGQGKLSKEAVEQVIYAQTGKHIDVKDAEAFKMEANGEKTKIGNPLSS